MSESTPGAAAEGAVSMQNDGAAAAAQPDQQADQHADQHVDAQGNWRGQPEPEYGFSALFTGARRMWRGLVPFAAAIGFNALVQTPLTYPQVVPGLSWGSVALAAVSAVLLIGTLAVMVATALRVAPRGAGHVGLGEAIKGAREHWGWFALWTVVVVGLATLGFAFGTYPGILVLMFLPYVGFAASQGIGHSLWANFKAVLDRPFRWLVTVLISALVLTVAQLLGAFNAFFISGMPSVAIWWVLFGIIQAWLLTAWASIWLSTETYMQYRHQVD